MSFARNFALGQQIAQTALDTYYDAREKARLRAIGEAKPEEIQNSYTTQDAEQLHALANAKDAQGNPYYNLEANADGSYGLKANFAYAGQDGQMVQPGGIATTFAPRTAAVEFMGTRYAPEDLNEDRIAALRARAMADVISERDPVRGLQMRRSIKSDEREDERFSWERQQQPLKQRGLEQQVRQGEIAVADAESAQAWKKGFGEAMAQYTGSQEQIAETAQYVNKNSRSITMGAPDPKTGLMNLSVVTPSGDSVFLQLNRADQARLYAAATMMRAHPMEALKEMSAVNKDLAEAFARENQLTKFLVDNTNDVVAKGHKMKVDEEELGIKRTEANNRGAYYRAAGRNRMEFVNDKGETVVLDMSLVPVDQNGQYQIPPGLRPKNAKPTADFVELPEDGTRVRDRNGNVYTYIDGERVLQGGVPSPELPKKLREWGFPPQAESLVQPMPGGRHVMVPNDSETVYDLADPDDRKMALAAVNRVTQASAAAKELQTRGGWAPRGTQGAQPVTSLSGYEQARQNAAALNNRPLLGIPR